MFFALQRRKGYVVANGKKTDDASSEERSNNGHLHWNADTGQEPVDKSADHTGHCIDFAVEDNWFVVQQNVADNAASRARDAAHDDSHPERLTKG